MGKLLDSLKHSWNLFTVTDRRYYYDQGMTYSSNPTRPVFTRGNERTIITSVYNRLATDAASIDIKHVKLDKNKRYSEDMNSGLNNCLTVEANIDQTSRAFIQDVIISMLDEGCVAVVPIETTINPNVTNSFDILSLRTGRITQWGTTHVEVDLYNERTGQHETIPLEKSKIAIIENPFHAVMNEPNSTMQRLIHKLSLMDAVDDASSSGKLDMIIQLPYTIKSQMKKEQAEERRKQIEEQLEGSRYGIAYIDGTEKVTQLNRSLDNNLLKQIEYLTNLLYSQLGLTQEILNGTADEKTMNNYYTRTVEPIVAAITAEFHRKFITKTGRTQGQAIMYFRDPFKLIPINEAADMADKFTRNEILSSNELRQIIGRKPSDDPKADELRNKNISQSASEIEMQNQNKSNPAKEESSNEE